jgi:hypothetical protein
MAALVHSGLGHGRLKGLARARPSGRSGARWLTGNGATEREEHGESVSGLTRVRAVAWQLGDDGEETVEEVLSVGTSWAWREEKEDGEASEALTRAQEAVRRPGDEGKAAVVA